MAPVDYLGGGGASWRKAPCFKLFASPVALRLGIGCAAPNCGVWEGSPIGGLGGASPREGSRGAKPTGNVFKL